MVIQSPSRTVIEKNRSGVPDPREVPTLSVEAAGHFLGLSRGTAYEAVRAGTIPCLRFGKRIVVPTAAIRRLLELDVAADERAPHRTTQ